MSSLNLNPNGLVIAAQTGIFFANYLVIKKLILKPYLEVRERRNSATTASLSLSDSLRSKNEAAQQEIQSKLTQAFDDIQKFRADIRSRANQERDGVLGGAETDAKGTISSAQENIRRVIKEEREKLPRIVDQVAALVFKKLVN